MMAATYAAALGHPQMRASSPGFPSARWKSGAGTCVSLASGYQDLVLLGRVLLAFRAVAIVGRLG